MQLRTRRAARLLCLAVSAVLVAALGAPALAAGPYIDYVGNDPSAVTPVERFHATARPMAGADDAPADLRNFSHVFNFNPGGAVASSRGTDIEFYTSVVPRRDYTTGELLLDADGNVIQEARDFAVMGTYVRGAYVFDITNPESPQLVTLIACNQSQNDVQIKQFGDRWILALAKDGGSGAACNSPRKGGATLAGIAVFDITDPYAFTRLYSFGVTHGAHNFTFHPTKPYGYVSSGELPSAGQGHVPIIDFTDLMNPTVAADPTLLGSPHDISFSADGSRAYVASENNMLIWNTTNPVLPAEVSVSPGPASYVHGTDPTPDGKHVILTDESLVLGGFPLVAGPRKGICPGGGITLYNIEGANESRPRPVGFAVANIQGVDQADQAACTAHVGRITANSKYYVTGWYRGGVRVFDLTNPTNPTDIGHAMMPGNEGYAGEVWAAKFYKGDYVYSADMRRGFDVFRWTGPTLGNPSTAAELATMQDRIQ